MEFNHLLIKAEHEVWPPERALIDHQSSPTSQSSPVRVHVDFLYHRTHRWINRPSDGGHSQLVRERRYQTVRISACIDAHKFKSYPESHPIIARMLTDLRIVSDFHDPIINDVFQSGRRVLNWVSNVGRTIIPLRVKIEVLHEHVRDERALMRRAMRLSAMERESENYGMVRASEKAIQGLNRKRMEIEGESCRICLDDFALGTKVTCLPCSHVFHEDCITTWLEKSHRCPVCRFEMLTSA
ncbi:E3 ubiquitin-protein ligase RING1-like [Actinidia chinensis var. chinensis]|uniref:RING-type E3 ubiquitin transferase n=1 Tax=Actinidia chinensis var. chinensis TaxID=1590841 RepID=A0A2R6QQY8_ACTCC|nr:E3 ubiquitin-protein ligase RING1-like [Actinidia chinensis var. chinensis]